MDPRIRSIGNVDFREKDVKDVKAFSNGITTHFVVFLKNGTTLSYKEQDVNNKARVTVGYDLGNDEKYGTQFFGITGLTVEGSEKNDYYYIDKCKDYNIKVKGGGDDEVRINDANQKINGSILMDANDTVTHTKNEKFLSRNEGFFIED